MQANLFDKLSHGVIKPNGKQDAKLLKQSEAQNSLMAKVTQLIKQMKPATAETQTQTQEFMFKRMEKENFKPVKASYDSEDYYDSEETEPEVTIESLQAQIEELKT